MAAYTARVAWPFPLSSTYARVAWLFLARHALDFSYLAATTTNMAYMYVCTFTRRAPTPTHHIYSVWPVIGIVRTLVTHMRASYLRRARSVACRFGLSSSSGSVRWGRPTTGRTSKMGRRPAHRPAAVPACELASLGTATSINDGNIDPCTCMHGSKDERGLGIPCVYPGNHRPDVLVLWYDWCTSMGRHTSPMGTALGILIQALRVD
jgi:hypothetical protein